MNNTTWAVFLFVMAGGSLLQHLAELRGWWGDPAAAHMSHVGVAAIFLTLAVIVSRLARLER